MKLLKGCMKTICKNMKCCNKSGKLFRIMVKELLCYTIMLSILLMIINNLVMYFAVYNKPMYETAPFNDNQAYFWDGQYDEMGFEKQYGKESLFYIFNKEDQLVYQNNKEIPYPYSKEETALIPREINKVKVETIGTGKVGSSYEEIHVLNDQGETVGITIIDEEKVVIFSTYEDMPDQLSDVQYGSIQGKNDLYEITKENYVARDNQLYTAVFFIPLHDIEGMELRRAFITICLAGFTLLMMMFTLFLYLVRLNKRIVGPVHLLNENITRFNLKEDAGTIKYEGPQEFEAIFAQFNDMSKRLKKAQLNNKKIVSGISHDVKGLISVIQLYSKLIRDDVVTGEKRQEYLKKIGKRTDELASLVTLFNEYSQLQRDDYEINLEYQDLIDFSDYYIKNKMDDIEVAGFHLELNLPKEPLTARVDVIHLRRALNNIISNAIKYNDPGVTIHFGVTKREDMVVIKIGNDGVPIDPVLRKVIFEEFTTSDQAKVQDKGTGLGMAITYKIMELHGGGIRLIKEEDSDLAVEFELFLPAYQ